jgi:hypothetical protein
LNALTKYGVLFGRVVGYLAIIGLVLYSLLDLFSPTTAGPESVTDATLISREIALGLFAYSKDHGGNYPDGKSSTEVFQKLLDAHYVSRADIFYMPLPGKTNAGQDARQLKPENVCWDVTRGVTDQSSDTVPVVFLTGYKVTYQPSSSALNLHPAGWWATLFDKSGYGIAVCYRSNSGEAMKAAANGSIPDFIPANFDPRGQTYAQLTPEGELGP